MYLFTNLLEYIVIQFISFDINKQELHVGKNKNTCKTFKNCHLLLIVL